MSRSLAKSGKATAMKLLNEKWLSIVQSAEERGENETGGSSTITLPLLLLRDPNSNDPLFTHSGRGYMSCGCSWATGAHMTEFSTYGTGMHGTSALGVSWGSQLTKGADIFGALGMNVLSGLTLEASHHGGCGRGRVRDVNGIGAGAGDSHNHLQSSRQSNASRAHRRSSSSVNSRPTSLSRSSVPPVTFSGGKGVQSARAKGICSSGQLGKWVDCSVCYA